MVLGIISVPLFCIWYISMPCAILAIIFGVIARGKAKRGEGGGAGMAMAGMICGVVSIGLVIFAIVGLLALFGYGGTKLQQEMERQRKLQQQQQGGGTGMLPMVFENVAVLWNIISTLVLRI
jgi:predicted metalloprotease